MIDEAERVTRHRIAAVITARAKPHLDEQMVEAGRQRELDQLKEFSAYAVVDEKKVLKSGKKVLTMTWIDRPK